MKISAVIGANFGDEGKGLTTDWLASKNPTNSLIVRHNGGAQAGHTVQIGLTRHVFNTLGSGSFLGVPTYYASHFIVDPWRLFEEQEKFPAQHGALTFHPNNRITTFWDVLINQIAEEIRSLDGKHHGSCGMGFNETYVRNEEDEYAFTVHDLFTKSELEIRQWMRRIRDEYIQMRFDELGLEPHLSANFDNCFHFALFDKQLDHLLHFRNTYLMGDMPKVEHVIFESSQGLQLDMDNMEMFPHLTRSNTGLTNIIEACQEFNLGPVDEIYYCTRSYVTRHGAGPLPHELKHKPYENIVDTTNIRNTWQESLRFSYLNLDMLEKAIDKDYWLQPMSWGAQDILMVTCMDQLDNNPKLIHGEELVSSLDTGSFLDYIDGVIQPTKVLTSWGPTRETITIR